MTKLTKLPNFLALISIVPPSSLLSLTKLFQTFCTLTNFCSPQLQQMCWIFTGEAEAIRRELFITKLKNIYHPSLLLSSYHSEKGFLGVVFFFLLFQLGKALLLLQAYIFVCVGTFWLNHQFSSRTGTHCFIASIRCLAFSWYSGAIWEVNEKRES